VLEPTFDGVYLFADISEALNQLRILGGVRMPKTKLAIRVVLTKGIYKPLIADEETEIVSTCHFLDLRLVAERHS